MILSYADWLASKNYMVRSWDIFSIIILAHARRVEGLIGPDLRR